MSTINSVCVYCGSSTGNDPAYEAAGEALGTALADAGLQLIYGGGTRGIMGAVARGVLQRGGKVGAIIPRFLTTRETNPQDISMLDDVTVVETMHERKHLMFERSDAFVALPGGLGTVEEIVEIMTWAQLGQHKKPMVFANINGFWNPMLELIAHMEAAGFLHSRQLLQPLVIDAVADIIPAIRAAAVPGNDDGNAAVIDKM